MKKVLLYSILIWLCATACSDYLDLKPSNIVTDEDVYANESGVKTALTRCTLICLLKIIVLINVGLQQY